MITTQKKMMTISNAILIPTATCTALMAGLFYSYSCSVVPGLKLLPDRDYIAAMQSINKAIQNPVFFTCFFGTLLLLPLSVYFNFTGHPALRSWLLLAATVIYLSGVFGVTVLGNIPLNNALEKFNLINASKEAIYLQREAFEGKWNNLNNIRTLSSILSLILVLTSCVLRGKAS